MFKTFFTLLKYFVVNAVITLASLAFALLFTELFIRTYMPTPNYGGGIRPAFYSNLFEYDEILGWKGVPNLHTPYFSKDFHITVSHDNAGYRNISPPYKPGENNFLLLGDSYAWGWGVEDEETAAAIFNSENSTDNLYSLGIAGYGTDQEYLALQKQLNLNPDNTYKGAILLFYMNDLGDISTAERYGYPKPIYLQSEAGQLALTNIPVPKKSVSQDIPVTIKPSVEYWSQNIQLLNFTGAAISSVIKATNDIHISNDTAHKKNTEFTASEKQSIDLATSILTNIKKTCLEHDMFFHVVFLMTKDTQAHNIELLQKLSEQLAFQRVEYSFFESRTFPRTDLWLDAHYTPYGQALLADHIADVIANKKQPATQ